jgi:hypothetical protein
MAVTREKYDPLKIDKLRYYLEDMVSKGQARPYEIFVDNLKVVPKTTEVKEFDSYEYYMTENTEKIRILIYISGQSPRNDQYCFYVQQAGLEKTTNGLGDIDGIIEEKLAERDREHEMKKLHAELSETKKQLEEAEEYTEILQQEIEEMKQNKFRLGKINLAEFASATLEGMLRRNPQILSKLPGGEMLAGLIEQDTREQKQFPATPAGPDGTVSFKSKTEQTPSKYQEYTALFQQLDHAFDDTQVPVFMQVLRRFCEDPPSLVTVAELLNIQTT